jgi:hypothetical protein
LGQHDVEQDQIGLHLSEQPHPLLGAVGGEGGETFLAQLVFDRLEDGRLVVDD